MWSSAASLGAPVTDPGGKVAAMTASHPRPARRRPSTVLTRCTSPGCGSTASSAGTCTDPHSHTRPRSLRTRSTIMMFSARSLGRKSSTVAAVPLMGDDHTRSSSRARNRSGDADATSMPWSGSRTTALNGAGLPAASAAPSAATSASGGSGALQPAGEVDLVDVAGADGGSDVLDRGLEGRSVEAGPPGVGRRPDPRWPGPGPGRADGRGSGRRPVCPRTAGPRPRTRPSRGPPGRR